MSKYVVVDSRGDLPTVQLSGTIEECISYISSIGKLDPRYPHCSVLTEFEYVMTVMALFDIEQLKIEELKSLSSCAEHILNECVVTIYQKEAGAQD